MIAREYSNSTNTTQRTLREQRMLATGHKASHSDRYIVEYVNAPKSPDEDLGAHVVDVQDTRTPRQRFDDGYDAYCRNLSVADLTDELEILGWWSANRAEGHCDTIERRLNDACERTGQQVAENEAILARMAHYV